MNCRKCGQPVSPTDAYCVYCGAAAVPSAIRVLGKPLFWLGLLSLIGGIAMMSGFAGILSQEGDSEKGGVFAFGFASVLAGMLLLWLSRRRPWRAWFWPGVVILGVGVGTLLGWLNLYHYAGFPYDSHDLMVAIFAISLPLVAVGSFCLWCWWPRFGGNRLTKECMVFLLALLLCLAPWLATWVTGGYGSERYILSFTEGFEDGAAERWHLDDGWAVTSDGGDYVLTAGGGSGRAAADPWVTYADNYILTAELKLLSGGSAGFEVRNSWFSDNTRRCYRIHVGPSNIDLRRVDNFSDPTLGNSQMDMGYGQWHKIQIAVSKGSVKVYVDGVLRIEAQDPRPIPPGRFLIVGNGGSAFSVDDILVRPLP